MKHKIEDRLYERLEKIRKKYNLNTVDEVIYQMLNQMKNHRLKLFDDEDSAQRVDLLDIFEND